MIIAAKHAAVREREAMSRLSSDQIVTDEEEESRIGWAERSEQEGGIRCRL